MALLLDFACSGDEKGSVSRESTVVGMIVAKTPIHHDVRILVAEEGNRDGKF